MTAATAARPDSGRSGATPAAPLFVVHVVDSVDERIAGRGGCVYTSPAQSRHDALVLAGLLVGGPVAPVDGAWTRTVAIAGGRRTVTLERADRAPSGRSALAAR